MQPKLYLQQHVYACGLPDVVLLDLKKNRYLAIPEHQSRLLAHFVPGWPQPITENDGDAESAAQSAAKIIDELISQEILTRTPSRGKDATPAAITAPEKSLIPPPQLIPSPTVSTAGRARRRLPALVIAAVSAAVQLRCFRIEKIVSQVALRKSRVGHNDRSSPCSEIAALVEDFYWLRPFIFSGSQKCLFHSLTLLNFLASFDVHPHWVFGVRKAPFRAHCWVQDADTIFNDTPDRVAMFTPIMVV
jgi:hypothetical protein